MNQGQRSGLFIDMNKRWVMGGGGGCHKGQRSKIRTFDKAVIGCPVTGSRGRRFTGSRGTPRVHWAVTSHCDVTPSTGNTW